MAVSGETSQPAGRGTDGSRLAVVLVNYGSHALLQANLDAGLQAAGIQVVVVDNHTTDEELAALQALAAERGWDVVASPTNVGFGDGVNAGVARAKELGCDAFVMLNPDAVVSVPVLEELHRSVCTDRRSLVCPRMNRSDGRHYFRGSMLDYASGRTRGGWTDGEDLQEGRHSWRPWLTGACLAMHQEAWDLLGGFRGGYFLYWEDVDISRRAADAGLRLVMRQDLVATHDEGGTQDKGAQPLSGTYYYWNTRNRLLFASEHLERRELLEWILRTPAESRQILLRGGRRQLLHSATPLTSTLRGAVDGLRLAVPALVRPAQRKQSAAGPRRAAGPDLETVLLAHPSPDLYGSDRVLLESVAALTSAGVRAVVALPQDGPLAAELRARDAEVRFVEMPVLRKSILTPAGLAGFMATVARSLPAQVRLARSCGADLLLVNTITLPVWPLAARLARIPSVVHVHEAEAKASRVVNTVLYAPLVLADRVVANSAHTRDVVTATHPLLRRRCTVVHNGVAGPGQVQPARLHQPAHLLFVGRLSPRKGPDVAVRALASVRGHGVDARLRLLGAVFPGYEWFEQELRQLVTELGLDEHVDFLGFDQQVWSHLADADVVLVPSVLEESFGNTAVEALLAARPLVVSDHSGLAEATAGYEAVRPVPAGAPEAIATVVAELLADHAGASRAALRDRDEALRRHAPQVYAQRLLAALRSTLR